MKETKYNFSFSDEVLQLDKKRMINQLWKLIPMREEEQDWSKHLDTLIVEIAGLNEVFSAQMGYLILLSKLEGLHHTKKFEVYRRTVFESISLLQELFDNE